MTKRRVYNVNPTGKGDWEVKEEGASRSVKTHEDKSDAIARAKVAEMNERQAMTEHAIQNLTTFGVPGASDSRVMRSSPERYP